MIGQNKFLLNKSSSVSFLPDIEMKFDEKVLDNSRNTVQETGLTNEKQAIALTNTL